MTSDAIAQVVIRDTALPAAIKRAPWTDMSGFPWREARFAEYRNTGPGAGTGHRPAAAAPTSRRGGTRRSAYLSGWNPGVRTRTWAPYALIAPTLAC